MALVEARPRYSPEDLLSLPDGERYELVDGELVEKDMGAESDWVATKLIARLENFDPEGSLGLLFGGTAGYQCFGEDRIQVRKPDVSFVRTGRLPDNVPPQGHILLHPDLAVEIVSPND